MLAKSGVPADNRRLYTFNNEALGKRDRESYDPVFLDHLLELDAGNGTGRSWIQI